MTVEKSLAKKNLRLMLNKGQKADGSILTKPKSFSNINPQAQDEAVYTAAESLASLMTRDLVEVETVETSVLKRA